MRRIVGYDGVIKTGGTDAEQPSNEKGPNHWARQSGVVLLSEDRASVLEARVPGSLERG